MSTGRSLISEVRSLNKLINSDNNITDRAIFGILKRTASLLIKRETNLRRLWNSPNIFTTVPCIKMIQVPLSECCDFKSSCFVARSEMKIPRIAEGIFGLLVQTVFSPGRKKFDYSSLERFVNIMKLNTRNKGKYYWFYNDYLYISDPDIEYIDLVAYFDEDINPTEFSSCQDGSEDSCVNPLDKEFSIPSYLEKSLLDMVHDTLNKTYFRHIIDPSPNARDEEKS